jgi:hypothetical protein
MPGGDSMNVVRFTVLFATAGFLLCAAVVGAVYLMVTA